MNTHRGRRKTARHGRNRAAAVVLTVVFGAVAAPTQAADASSPGATAASRHREPAAVIALPLPPGAVGGDLTAAHTGQTYIGNAAFPDGTEHPVLWHRTGFATFTSHVLPLPSGMDFGWSSGSNARGAITVSDSGPDSSAGFVLFHGRTYRLRDLAGTRQTDVYGINAGGMAFGDALTASGDWVAVGWTHWTAAPSPLDLPPGMTGAVAIGANNRGELVGSAYNDTVLEAVRWSSDGRASVLPILSSPDSFSQAFMISRFGRAVGEATWPPNGDDHATAWPRRGAPVDLGTLPGDVTSRMFEGSPDGRASGVSFNADRTFARAAYWPGHGPLQTLPPYGNPAWGSSGHGVSDDGEVQGATIQDLEKVPVGDIPTLWTDADAQAFVPAATAVVTRPPQVADTPLHTTGSPRQFAYFNRPSLHRR